jgi:hypothetical protein
MRSDLVDEPGWVSPHPSTPTRARARRCKPGEEGDYLQPGNGADNTFGDSGNDTGNMNADGAADYVDCGDGDDTVNATDLDPTDSFFGCENINVS